MTRLIDADALEDNHYSNSSDKAIALYNKAISATPAESLQDFDEVGVSENCNSDDELTTAIFKKEYVPAGTRLYALKGKNDPAKNQN